ncbi:hypothetical protein PR048_005211 [Dryococelus australis]|uniref:Uncharacterized protein n=1 Tax=Dryococelus australis TaxID=614101 RepID=A0ABQ9I8P3_9NEOP|nr:hypothetical protein PR048_005211 [Dryococelus australis]
MQLHRQISRRLRSILKHSSRKSRITLIKKTVCRNHVLTLFRTLLPQTKVSHGIYLRVFRERFDLQFGPPQIDTCCSCESLTVKIKSPLINDTAKRVTVARLMEHKRRIVCKKPEIFEHVMELNPFSDECPAQNKNSTVVRVTNCLVSSGWFKDVKQYYPLWGYPFLSCDRTFTCVKLVIRIKDRI